MKNLNRRLSSWGLIVPVFLFTAPLAHAQPVTGYALSMDGNYSEIQVPALNLDNSSVDGISFEMWIKPSGTQQQNDGLWMFRTNDGSDIGIDSGLQFRDGAMRLGWPATPTTDRIEPQVVPPNDSWTHIAVVLGRTEKTLYFNGVPQGSNTYADTDPYTFDTLTGIANDNVAGLNRSFTGLIDDVRVWQEARTAQEILDNMNGFSDGTNLVLHYTFDDQAPGVATDSVGSADGLITGGTYVENVPSDDATLSELVSDAGFVEPRFQPGITEYTLLVPPGTTTVTLTTTENDPNASVSGDGAIDVSSGWATADIVVTAQDETTQLTYTVDIAVSDYPLNYALYLPGGDGNSSNVDISGLGLNSLPYTIEMWMKPEVNQTYYAGLLYNRPGNIGLQYTGSWQATSQSVRFMSSAGSQYGEGTETADVLPGEWHHVAVVITDTSRTVYLDGVGRTETSTFVADDFTTGDTYLGWDSATTDRAFRGWIDEVRVWSVAKTAQELAASRLETLDPASESNLLAYWSFDDITTDDQSGNAYHGTPNGTEFARSSIFDPMVYLASDVSRTERFVGDASQDNRVASLEIVTDNSAEPLRLAALDLDTFGTSDTSEISNVKIYYTGSDDWFHKRNLVAELGGSPGSQSFQMSMDYELGKGSNFFWITYDIVQGATEGNTFDVDFTSFDLTTDDGTMTLTPTTSAPSGALTVWPDLFIRNIELPTDTVTTGAFVGASFASFQQQAVTTFNGYQYVAYWTAEEKVAIARKQLPAGTWEELTLDYVRSNGIPLTDDHQSISVGICANDGTIHISYDQHDVPLQYQKSVPGLATDPGQYAWASSSFGAQQDYLVPGTQVTPVTYPRFISKPDGDLLFECRLGQSGNGDSYIWDYSGDTGTWQSVGKYIDGTSVSQNAYINGMHYDLMGGLHVSWIWRETPDPQTNHDVYYAYSDDDGRTWLNGNGVLVGTTGTSPMLLSSTGLQVVTIGSNRGLINQEAQVVDSTGGIHILQSYMSDDHPNSTDFWQARIDNADLRHIYQDFTGTWHSDIIAPSGRNRSDIAVDRYDNLYVVSGDHRIFFAAASDDWQTWVELDTSKAGFARNEGFIDREQLLEEGILSYLFTSADNDGSIQISNYQLATDDSTLSTLSVNGTPVPDFDPSVFTYDVELPAGSTSATIEGTATDSFAVVEVTNPTALPGSASVEVAAGYGDTTSTYTVNLTVARPCSGICEDPEYFELSFSPGSLGLEARCFETLAAASEVNCGNFDANRTLTVNGELIACDYQNHAVPAARNGGYCVSVSAGETEWAYMSIF